MGAEMSRPPTVKPKVKTFHAVEIRCTPESCAAARKLEGKRYLSNQSPPQLPLAECDRAAQCHCRYVHHPDRRTDDDRRAFGAQGSEAAQLRDNTRTGRFRRQSDH
jgi:hypothetical protein